MHRLSTLLFTPIMVCLAATLAPLAVSGKLRVSECNPAFSFGTDPALTGQAQDVHSLRPLPQTNSPAALGYAAKTRQSHDQPASTKDEVKPTAQVNVPEAMGAALVPALAPVPRADKWWQERHAAMNERVKQGAAKGDIGVLFVGDSITQGWEGEGKNIWQSFYQKRNSVNLGIGGDRTQHVLWRLQNGNAQGLAQPAAGTAPKVAVVMIGTNNVSDTPPAETAAGISAIVSLLKQKVPGIKVLVLGIFPRDEKPAFAREKNTQVNDIIRSLDDGKHVYFMDIGATFLNADGTISKEVMPDFLHLSADGYRRWAEAIEPKLSELLGEPASKPAK